MRQYTPMTLEAGHLSLWRWCHRFDRNPLQRALLKNNTGHPHPFFDEGHQLCILIFMFYGDGHVQRAVVHPESPAERRSSHTPPHIWRGLHPYCHGSRSNPYPRPYRRWRRVCNSVRRGPGPVPRSRQMVSQIIFAISVSL
jgi:hypothetical protein